MNYRRLPGHSASRTHHRTYMHRRAHLHLSSSWMAIHSSSKYMSSMALHTADPLTKYCSGFIVRPRYFDSLEFLMTRHPCKSFEYSALWMNESNFSGRGWGWGKRKGRRNGRVRFSAECCELISEQRQWIMWKVLRYRNKGSLIFKGERDWAIDFLQSCLVE